MYWTFSMKVEIFLTYLFEKTNKSSLLKNTQSHCQELDVWKSGKFKQVNIWFILAHTTKAWLVPKKMKMK